MFVCLFSIFRPHRRQCLLPKGLCPCCFPIRCARQFSNYMIACSVAPTPLKLFAEALHSFDVFHPFSEYY
ncbi:BgTH12-03125 [Blumeria graminis f. sp. triticale]|uniref:BgTH12-03125 n=1 Tax=Blumeria graminis f. sp. triticale TaxID=1689686 RepID=A0A9W4D3K1_BLUGR|nr:BgTH12-03125 [Blumeria graminis f. sp. triticale]